MGVNQEFLMDFKAGNDMKWDWSVLVPNGNESVVDYMESTHPDFPNMVENEYMEFTTPNTYVMRKSYFTADDNGIHEVGSSYSENAYSIMQFTGNASDSFFLPAQKITYPTKRTVMKFPCTVGSSWVSGYETDFNAALTITGYFLDKAPMVRRTKVVQYDSVIGWGQMRVPAGNGKSSIQYPVLLIARIQKIVHNYTLNGAPAPAQLLQAFQLVQNDSSSSWSSLFFWRGGNQIPLARMNFDNTELEANGNTTLYTDSREIQVDETSGINDQLNESVNITPNPVSGSNVKLTLSSPFTGGEIALYNALGVRVELPSFFMNGVNELTINTNTLSNGTYTVMLRDENGINSKGTFVVVK